MQVRDSIFFDSDLTLILGSVVARAFTFEVGLQFAVVRARLLRANPSNPAGMAAVAASEERIDHYIDSLGLRGLLAIAVYNGAEAHVVSGNLKAIETLLVAVKRDGLRCTKLNVDQGMILHRPSSSQKFQLGSRIPQFRNRACSSRA